MSLSFVDTFQDQLSWIGESKMQQDSVLLEGDMLESPTKSGSTDSGFKSKAFNMFYKSVLNKQDLPGKLQESLDTLDEPISDTLSRDLRGIAVKIRHVLLPTSSASAYKSVMKDWDLWVRKLTESSDVIMIINSTNLRRVR